jgi:hypothetical protein
MSRIGSTEASSERVDRRRWVCRKPAVSFIDMTPTVALVAAANLIGMRVSVVPGRSEAQPTRDRHDGRMATDDGTGLITSVIDTSISVFAPVPATARALGIVLTLKNSYHVALVLGLGDVDPEQIGAVIAGASDKTLGPDFGLCCDTCSDRFSRRDTAELEIKLRASDRRAFETVRPLYEAINGAAIYERF